MATMTWKEKLEAIQAFGGTRDVKGLEHDTLASFAASDPLLVQAIDEAWDHHHRLREQHGDLLSGSESSLKSNMQLGFVNFYASHAVNPYTPLAARGSWIVTTHGAVLHDSGGYGMLGLGHGPQEIIDAMSKPWVVANIMTPSFSQMSLIAALRREIGHTRGGCPFHAFLCMNSGSESVTVAARLSDLQAGQVTHAGGRHEGKHVKFLAIHGGFHGRTDRPAQASGSSMGSYRRHLASYRERDNLVTIPPNDIDALEAAFVQAEKEGVFFEMMLVEPVMGEGNPGLAMTRAFYDRARALTAEMGTLLLVDSIQAGLRVHGTLSVVDYPGFEDATPPDLETYSKALNAAQYPMSVLAMNEHAAALHTPGIYGNTMTGNPRACEVAVATLAHVDEALRENIRARGAEFVERLSALADKMPHVITDVQGTGLLLSATLVDHLPIIGTDAIEEQCRRAGIGVIHGGHNALRFTPSFRITSEEIVMVVARLAEVLSEAATQSAAAAK
jgi:acetylornithine/succinyldiaminopimelate/putrescine aminotransferase